MRICGLVVDSDAGGRPSSREIIYGHPRDDFLVGPRIRICPVMQFLHNEHQYELLEGVDWPGDIGNTYLVHPRK